MFFHTLMKLIMIPLFSIILFACGIKNNTINKTVITKPMSISDFENAQAPFTLPPLPFTDTALEPMLSKESFDYHYRKHHNAYIVKLNELVEGTDYKHLTLKEIIIKSNAENKQAIFNNAAQAWNHTFFWHSMAKNGGINNITPSAKKLVEQSFETVEKFKAKLLENGIGQFGSGWVWIVLNKDTGKLEVIKTSNASTPLTDLHLKPIIAIDIWEHAYYIDYRNKRPDYLTMFIENLIDWDFFEKNIK